MVKFLRIINNTLRNEFRRRATSLRSRKNRRTLRVLLLGATQCGKSAFLQRILFDTYERRYTPTIEDYYEKTYTYKNYIFNLGFIDTCGPYEFPAVRDVNISNADVALLMYDMSDVSSIETASDIFKMIHEVRGSSKPLHTFIVGTKADLCENSARHLVSLNEHFASFDPCWTQYHQSISSKADQNMDVLINQVLDHLLLVTPEKQLDRVIADYKPKSELLCCLFCRSCCCNQP